MHTYIIVDEVTLSLDGGAGKSYTQLVPSRETFKYRGDHFNTINK